MAVTFSSCVRRVVATTATPRRRTIGSSMTTIPRRWICSSKLVIEKTQDTSRFDRKPDNKDLVFGTTLSDHMLMVEWINGDWQDPRIVPYQDLQLSPASSALHYGTYGNKSYCVYSSTVPTSFNTNTPSICC